MTWSYMPGWAFMVAVLAFPLGLVALIARTSVIEARSSTPQSWSATSA
jgi:hypothetical protein